MDSSLGEGRLDERAIARTVSDMLAMDTTPERFGAFLFTQSEGNPFFVAEYLRLAVADGVLWRDQSGRWQIEDYGERAEERRDYERLPIPRLSCPAICMNSGVLL